MLENTERHNLERKCPFCAEMVKAEAILCKHCRSELSPVEQGVSNAPPRTEIDLPEEGESEVDEVRCVWRPMPINGVSGIANPHPRSTSDSDKFDVYLYEDEIYIIPSSARDNVNWTNIGVAAGGGALGFVTGPIAALAGAAWNAARNKSVNEPLLSRKQLQIATENSGAICIDVSQSEIVATETRTSWDMFGGDWFTWCRIKGKYKVGNKTRVCNIDFQADDTRARSSEFLKSLKELGIKYSVLRD